MVLLGIDVGTTGCKVSLFSPEGEQLAGAYREYDMEAPRPGQAQLDATAVWEHIKDAVREVTAATPGVSIKALSASSMGESVVPVSADRQILGPSILNFDARGAEFLPDLSRTLPDETLYAINGNTLGNHYSLTKLKWIKKHQPDLYRRTCKFLHWGAFVAFMLGGQAAVDYSLANRTLLFDLGAGDWSDELLAATGLDRDKLPPTVPSGTITGTVSKEIAAELGLDPGVLIVSGAHDQNTAAVGCGVIDNGQAVYSMGTFQCITPVFSTPPPANLMLPRGLNTEHHAVGSRFVSFIYNQGGAIVKWYRDNYAAEEHQRAEADGRSVYPDLFAEMPPGPGRVMVLPHFSVTGPPDFIADSAGLIAGLRLDTTRGEILRGIIEGVTFMLKEVVDTLPGAGIAIDDYRVSEGGSRSDAWVQTCADIFGKPMTRTAVVEAGAMGTAMIAGVGSGLFDSYEQAVEAMVTLERTFEPDARQHEAYQERYALYRRMWPQTADFLRDLAASSE